MKDDEARALLRRLVDGLRDRHYGRMPPEVQQPYDAALAFLATPAAPAAPAEPVAGPSETVQPDAWLDANGRVVFNASRHDSRLYGKPPMNWIPLYLYTAPPPPSAEAEDAARVEWLERWLVRSRAKGFHFNSASFDTDRSVREQIDERIKAEREREDAARRAQESGQ